MFLRGLLRLPPLAVLVFMLSASTGVFAQNAMSVFPQFASGGGWSSDLFLANQGTLSTIVDVSFWGDDGTALTVDSTLGVGASFAVTLGGGRTQVVRVSSTGDLKTGYVLISFPSGASIRASEVFKYESGGEVVSALGVDQQFPDMNYSFPAEVDSDRGLNTGLAVALGSFDGDAAAAQQVVVNLIRADGTLQDTAVISLGASQHTALFLNAASLFPGLDDFSGSVSVSSARPFGLVALRQDHAVFGTIAVAPGPMVAPFLLTRAATSEVEPNNNASQAQRISSGTVISGNISVAGDIDWFQFTGQVGDVVTAVVSTASLGSALDSVLYLVSSDGQTVVAQNDENGLLNQSDSFIQAVLPSSGTFYVAVTDYQSRGGFNGTYRLHFQTATPVTR